MPSYANLHDGFLVAIDNFLEAATVAQKWAALTPVQTQLDKAMRKAFTAQGRAFLEGFAELAPLWEAQVTYFADAHRQKIWLLREAISPTDWLVVFDRAAAATFNLFRDPLLAANAAGLQEGAESVLGDLDIATAFDLRNPRAVQYLQQHGALNVSSINATTRGYLQTLITQAVDEGWSYQRTARAISARYREFAVGVPQQHIRSRAELVAITESGNAYEAGSSMVVRDLVDGGLRMQKSWLTVGDNRVDPHCKANEAQGWIDFDEPFSDGSMQPLAHPGCRCSALYRRAPAA